MPLVLVLVGRINFFCFFFPRGPSFSWQQIGKDRLLPLRNLCNEVAESREEQSCGFLLLRVLCHFLQGKRAAEKTPCQSHQPHLTVKDLSQLVCTVNLLNIGFEELLQKLCEIFHYAFKIPCFYINMNFQHFRYIRVLIKYIIKPISLLFNLLNVVARKS